MKSWRLPHKRLLAKHTRFIKLIVRTHASKRTYLADSLEVIIKIDGIVFLHLHNISLMPFPVFRSHCVGLRQKKISFCAAGRLYSSSGVRVNSGASDMTDTSFFTIIVTLLFSMTATLLSTSPGKFTSVMSHSEFNGYLTECTTRRTATSALSPLRCKSSYSITFH